MNRPDHLPAVDIARALGQPEPTPEQAAVIEARPGHPLLVVAGAGSGKTETMASRVVWLVANHHVEPDQVLGLTFTRKAATELSERLTARLARLQRSGLWTPPEDDLDAEALGGTPTVSTYHSYAGRLVREHALRLGYESESRLLSEAAAWQYAAEVVQSYDGTMEQVSKAVSTITAAVVDLAGEMSEHLLTTREVADHLAAVEEALARLPRGESRVSKELPAQTLRMRDALRERAAILPIVERYLALKRTRDAMDFADQMALAARLARSFTDIGAIERSRFRAVLLDEFQDTSEAQLELLRALFVTERGDVPVTAVGDPNQSIYGWRGASSTTLSRFPRLFQGAGQPATVLPLSTSWRNSRAVLRVANRVADPLRSAARVPVEELRPAPAAGTGRVSAARLATIEEEADHVARWIAHRRGAGATSCAVLCRKRSMFAPVIEALERRGVPHEVVGLGGLLLTPEIEDVVALLHAVQDPSRGDHLMRLLTGPLCRLGPADLDGLAAWARHQQQLRRGAEIAPDGVREQSPDASDAPSIVEALEELPGPGWRDEQGRRIGAVARERLGGLSRVVRRLRSMTGLPLADLVGEAERALGLDVEVLARPGYTPAAARAHLDAFADVAAGFTVSADRPTLAGFLSWLEAALAEERGLDKGYVEASTDAVQVLTVHAAKGLEWDAVAIPGLVESSFPAHSGNRSVPDDGFWRAGPPRDRGWIGGLAGVPFDLRGDRDGLPVLDWGAARDFDDMERRVEAFIVARGEHGVVEERRLAYVALTRARSDLLLTSSVWSTPTTPRVTSRFLEEVLDGDLSVDVELWADLPDAGDAAVRNPRAESPPSALWPVDHLRERRVALAAGATRVRAAIDAGTDGPQGQDPSQGEGDLASDDELSSEDDLEDEEDLLGEVDLLLAERDRRRHPGPEILEIPRHLSTSAVVDLARDPAAFARRRRRPLPTAPAVAARRGTAFHAWVEQHYARAAIVDIAEMPGSADEHPGAEVELPRMKSNFLASTWSARTPVEVETTVETVLDGIAVRGRIDAVFPDPDGGVTIVDWKTGRSPQGPDAEIAVLQLAAYRIAYARLRGVDPAMVRAAFFYAGTGETVWPHLPEEDRVIEVLRTVPDS